MSRWPESKRNADGKLALTWWISADVPGIGSVRQWTLASDMLSGWQRSDVVTFQRAADQVNSSIIIRAQSGKANGGIPGAGALAISGTVGDPREIILNLDYGFNETLYAGIVGHEIGHVLGLGHSSDPNDLMFESQHGAMSQTPNDLSALRMLYDLPPLGGPTVPTKADDSQLIGFTKLPALAAGQEFQASFTFKNVGSAAWTIDGARQYHLGAQAPRDNTFWNQTARVFLPATVQPGDQVTITGIFKVPLTSGPWQFAWQMVHEDIDWFGAVAQQTIQVADQPIVTSGPPIGSLVLDGWTPTGWRKI